MGLNLVTPPASDPISLAEAKSHCRITGTEEDGVLAGYILAARMHAETYLRRCFVNQTWDFAIDSDWPQDMSRDCGYVRDRIVLPKPPVQSVTSIQYVDVNGITQTLDTDQYRTMNLNQERAEAFIDPAYGAIWPAVRRQAQAITVRFVCGYHPTMNSFPEPIRQAMLLLIGGWYEHREHIVVGQAPSELPMGVEALLFPYRVFY